MSIKNLQCECCLGQLYLKSDNIYKCESCGKEIMDDFFSNVEQDWLSNANLHLRSADFDKAYDLFESITHDYPNNYEAYFGLALASNGVVFITDDNKKAIPTCYTLSKDSFLEDVNYLKAYKLCPKELQNNLEEQAKKIEEIRLEWLDIASKEKPYDIFLSFKRTEEDGVTNTNDYANTLLIYNILKDNGYNVFFSPISLLSSIGKKYEPEIYRALHSSKVMIVYGERPDRFTAKWVQNEWSRYLIKLNNKEKQSDSLIVVYRNFNPAQLPKKLKMKQALDATNINFKDDLLNHIRKIMNSYKTVQTLTPITIKSEGVGSINRTINQETIKIREIGSNYKKTESVSVQKILDVVKQLIKNGEFDLAETQLKKVYSLDQDNSDAKLYSFFIKYRIKDFINFHQELETNVSTSLAHDLDNLISTADKTLAMSLINIIKTVIFNIITENETTKSDAISIKQNDIEDDLLLLYDIISKYNYPEKDELNQAVLQFSINENLYLKLFNTAIKTLNNNQVEDYIFYHQELLNKFDYVDKFDKYYIKNALQIQCQSLNDLLIYYAKKLLNVDKGNHYALFILYINTNDISYIETALKYSENEAKQLDILSYCFKRTESNLESYYDDLLKYIPINYEYYYLQVLKNRYEQLKDEAFCFDRYSSTDLSIENQELLNKLLTYTTYLLNINNHDSNILFDAFIYKMGYFNKDHLLSYPQKISKTPEFNELFEQVDSDYVSTLLKFKNEQEKYFEQKEEEKIKRKRNEEERKRKDEEKRREERNKRLKEKSHRSKNIFLIGLSIVVLLGTIITSLIDVRYIGSNISYVLLIAALVISIIFNIKYSYFSSSLVLILYILLCGIFLSNDGNFLPLIPALIFLIRYIVARIKNNFENDDSKDIAFYIGFGFCVFFLIFGSSILNISNETILFSFLPALLLCIVMIFIRLNKNYKIFESEIFEKIVWVLTYICGGLSLLLCICTFGMECGDCLKCNDIVNCFNILNLTYDQTFVVLIIVTIIGIIGIVLLHFVYDADHSIAYPIVLLAPGIAVSIIYILMLIF